MIFKIHFLVTIWGVSKDMMCMQNVSPGFPFCDEGWQIHGMDRWKILIFMEESRSLTCNDDIVLWRIFIINCKNWLTRGKKVLWYRRINFNIKKIMLRMWEEKTGFEKRTEISEKLKYVSWIMCKPFSRKGLERVKLYGCVRNISEK